MVPRVLTEEESLSLPESVRTGKGWWGGLAEWLIGKQVLGIVLLGKNYFRGEWCARRRPLRILSPELARSETQLDVFCVSSSLKWRRSS